MTAPVVAPDIDYIDWCELVAKAFIDIWVEERPGVQGVSITAITDRLDGAQLRFTSLHGRWVSVHDALAEQFEVELLVPLDGESEKVADAAFGD